MLELDDEIKQVAQLSLTNPSTRYITTNGKILRQSRDHNHTPILVICHPVARIDIAYPCTKFDDFRFSCSNDMIGAPKICNGSYDLTTPLETVCRP